MMLIIGLTGSIGMGKSTVAAHMRKRGLAVIDADAVVHDLYRGDAVAPIEAAFPGVSSDGVVDRQRLSARLLADPAAFGVLERIVHPLVQAAERDLLRAASIAEHEIAVLEVPLLFETGGDCRVDLTVVVSAPLDVQRTRVLARPGMTAQKLDQILARQLGDAEKRRRADHVVDTGRDLDVVLADVDQLIASWKGRAGAAYRQHWS